ncbi:MAG: hypothetical protein ABSA49_13700 [Rhizomicrobium sp.]|jgi:hypothetical protein
MRISLAAATAVAAVGASLAFGAPAFAQGVHVGVGVGPVGVGVGVGGPAPAYYYNEGFYPPGPCANYNYYYNGDCGYPVYSGDVDFDGAVVTGPHYYRWAGDHPEFWYRGGWHQWDRWHDTRWNWEHRGWDHERP